MLVLIWLGWPLVIAMTAFMTFYAHFPLGAIALEVAYLPANASRNLMLTNSAVCRCVERRPAGWAH